MEIFRRYFVVILLTVIIGIVWGGIVLLSNSKYSSLNPNAENYTKPLSATFDKEVLDSVSKRTKDSFPILPESFFQLNPD